MTIDSGNVGNGHSYGTVSDDVTTDMARELAKAYDTLSTVERYLARLAEKNAALHCAERVIYSPLHARVTGTMLSIRNKLSTLGVSYHGDSRS
jgi:hypothetical protein